MFIVSGGVAQLGEHLPCKQGVMSSNLTISTRCGEAFTSENVVFLSRGVSRLCNRI